MINVQYSHCMGRQRSSPHSVNAHIETYHVRYSDFLLDGSEHGSFVLQTGSGGVEEVQMPLN